MVNLRENYWAVKAPEGAKNIEILPGAPQVLSYEYAKECGERYDQWSLSIEDVPHGTWQIVCTSKEASEQQAAGIVEEHRIRGNLRYEDYTREFMWQETALESLNSLLTSKGCDINKNWLILKKQ